MAVVVVVVVDVEEEAELLLLLLLFEWSQLESVPPSMNLFRFFFDFLGVFLVFCFR